VVTWGAEGLHVVKKAQDMYVAYGTVENTGNEIVRRATLIVDALDKTRKKNYGHASFSFRDVLPDVKIPVIFEFPYVSDSEEPGELCQWMVGGSDKPVYKFEASVIKITPDGQRSGTVRCSVTNRSEATASVIDVSVVLYNNRKEIEGWLSQQISNLEPNKTREFDIPWKYIDSREVAAGSGTARAQIGVD
jgi:hypothetical protein